MELLIHFVVLFTALMRVLLFPSVFMYVVAFVKGLVNNAFVALCKRMRLFQ